MNKRKLAIMLDCHHVYCRKEAECKAAKESVEMDIIAEIHNMKIDLPVKVCGATVNVVDGVLEVTR